MSDVDPAKFAEFADWTTEELLERLVDESVLGASFMDKVHKHLVGRALFEGWWTGVKDRVCSARFEAQKSENAARDAAAIYDFIASLTGQIPVATMAVLVARYGLDVLCKDWNGGSPSSGLVQV